MLKFGPLTSHVVKTNPMKLIADSGATKTDWVIIQGDNELQTVQTIGFNPYFIQSEGILNELEKNLYPYLDNDQVTEVFFYGAGCSNPRNCDIVHDAMKEFFRKAEISVEHDLLGAARALCGHHPGIACILGTGSNSCYFDGTVIKENIPSLGFILADEGSGAFMGKQLMRDYFLNEMPADIKEKFESQYPLTLERVLDATYNKPHPNRYLASFTHFLSGEKDHPYINSLIKSSFDAFFRVQVMKYSKYRKMPLHAVGSVAFYFRELFTEVAEGHGVRVEKILHTPIEGLVHFHSPDVSRPGTPVT
jgi:N-acetylglucosamine kinase-like BadF-type ATPase